VLTSPSGQEPASDGVAEFRITAATSPDREWAAQLMVRSEPWTTLRRPLEACRAVLNDPEFQVCIGRVGLGTRFISFAEDYFRPRSRHLFLCVSSFNDRARRLYERLGYEPVGAVKDLAIEGASELLMCKRLK